MNDKKFAFIICSNNSLYLNECLHYISCLNVPDSYETEIITITDAEYMTKAYNAAMHSCDAKYKIYLHQDSFIINRNLLYDILKIFENPDVGMIGVAGAKSLQKFFPGLMWTHGMVYMNAVNYANCEFFSNPDSDYECVEAIDGLMMITQYDVPWREDIYTGWHYYDISQSLEFIKHNYKIAVPKQLSPWVMHDHGIMSYTDYHYWKNRFLEENHDYFDNV